MTGPVDWELARRVAVKVSGREPFSASYHYAALRPDFERFTVEAEELVAETTGMVSTAGAARARVVDRSEWISANIDSFQRLLRPVTDKLNERVERSRFSDFSRRMAGAELGVVLGWMSTRVLGQYDLLIIEDERPEDQDIVYYVGPNILALEKRHGFPHRQFRLWLALHECTHRAQFTGVPWLRPHFLSLVESTLDAVDPEPSRVFEAAKEIIEAKREGRDILGQGGLPLLMASPDQRVVIERLTGMMALLEGHGDVTMDRAGADRLPAATRFGQVLRERRNSAKGVSRIFQKLLGIEAKLNQYAAGEQFIEAVEDVGGPELVDRAWLGPENLPTMDEIKEPSSWIERVGPVEADRAAG